jgi:hypothetical protein
LGRGGHTAGEPTRQHARHGRSQQERTRAAPGEPTHLQDQVTGIAVLKPLGDTRGALGGLVGEIGHRAGLLAAPSHLMEFVGHRMQAVRRLSLARAGLLLHLVAGLVE